MQPYEAIPLRECKLNEEITSDLSQIEEEGKFLCSNHLILFFKKT
jgi:hypothetical protein